MSATLSTPRLVALLVTLPFLVLLLIGLRDWRQSDRLFPGLDPSAVTRIELARGRAQVVLLRRADLDRWVVLSAADAPADERRIDALLRDLTRLRGRPPVTPLPAEEPLQLRLYDRQGLTLASAGFFDRRAVLGARHLMLDHTPSLPLWPSAWSTLQPPRIAADSIVSARRISAAGSTPLSPSDTARLGTILSRLSAQDFVAAASVNWAGADYLQATRRDGSLIEIQSLPAGDGRNHVRLTSPTDPELRMARRYAWRVEPVLP
ncbi:hypothetical protein [Sandaracinobacteroides saxicola]|uniref:DUF4340 domain-containing protein n=1 Tax=Sandaracinobacteroides saxicola TaxID=2759707 RepID=A0A7G5IG92_9SPHN|nr:hypothetical protein [Sandaracinobacteroides saxicola]QMW22384.1 hypothetical protein H3309_13680 [Sandaracinobacteroides saxicola]